MTDFQRWLLFRVTFVPTNPKNTQFCQENKHLEHSACFVLKFTPLYTLIRIAPKCLTFFNIFAMVLPKIHHRFLKLFCVAFFKPYKMPYIMESTRQKTFMQLRSLSSVAAVLVFHSATGTTNISF